MSTLEETALWLEAGAPERRFNMNRLLDVHGTVDTNWCGTECCIAGYVVTRWADPHHVEDIEATAAKLLGITPRVANALFYPKDIQTDEQINGTGWEDIRPQQAAQAVRNVMKYNDPKWEEILE